MTVRQKFKSAVKRGTGGAHLLIKDNPKVDFSNEIIKAALANSSYDPQSEGSRAVYIFELILLSNQKPKIRQAILKALATERNDTWALDQLFDITALFAKQGDKEARRAIYKRLYKKTIQGSESLGEEAIIEIDGFEGLKYIAETKGKLIQKNPDEYEDGWRVDYFQEQNPTIKVYDELKKASKGNDHLKTFLQAIKNTKAKNQNWETPKDNYEIVTERINRKAIVPLHSIGTTKLSKKDIKKLAEDFLKQTDRLKLEKYLRVFESVKFPYDYQPILKLAKRKNSNKDRLVEFACGALQYFSGPDIRKFAIKKLKETNRPSDYLDLLVSNYKKGDSKLLVSLLEKAQNEHKVHSLVWSYINIYKANATKECVMPLSIMYDKLTCGVHRKDIVKIMLDNNVLPDRIVEEIKYDSYNETRKLLRK